MSLLLTLTYYSSLIHYNCFWFEETQSRVDSPIRHLPRPDSAFLILLPLLVVEKWGERMFGGIEAFNVLTPSVILCRNEELPVSLSMERKKLRCYVSGLSFRGSVFGLLLRGMHWFRTGILNAHPVFDGERRNCTFIITLCYSL
jgi:hypothetical protein